MSILRQRPAKITVDVLLLVSFVVVFLTGTRFAEPGYLVHGVLGLAIAAVIGVHLASNWLWIARVAARRQHDQDARLGLFNAVFGTAMLVCTVSGIPLWINAESGGVLLGLHEVTALLSTVMLLVHLIWNQRRIRALFRRRCV